MGSIYLATYLLMKVTLDLVVLINFSSFVSSQDKGTHYVGCFNLPPSVSIDITVSGANQCIQVCLSTGYYYAGIKNNRICECYEWEPPNNARLPEQKCNKCLTRQYCTSIYMTDQGFNAEHYFDSAMGYLGCYYSNAVLNLLAGYNTELQTMTPEQCISICQYKRFTYAGVRSSGYCGCGNYEPINNTRVNSRMCNQRCWGDPSLVCGGLNEFAIYCTGVTGYIPGIDNKLQLEGCYSVKIDTGAFRYFSDLSPYLCVRDCTRKNFLFARLYNGAYCYCSNNVPQHMDKRMLSDCNTQCVGEPQLYCGGLRTNLVYRTQVVEYKPGDAYMGCYVDEVNRRLTGKKTISRDMTPSVCIATCSQLGYAFAGVQFSYKCFCGNENPSPGDKRPEAECNSRCTGDPYHICGGTWRNSIYKTSGRAPLPDNHLKYYGCYQDKYKRKLKGYRTSDKKMTPFMCVDICRNRKFVYAGAQYSKQCFCGNETPVEKDKAPEGDCNKPCKGDPRYICGGSWRNSIYLT